MITQLAVYSTYILPIGWWHAYLPPIKGTRNLHWSWINTRFHDSLHRCWHLRGVGHSRFSFCRWHPEGRGWYPWHTLLETGIAIEKGPLSNHQFSGDMLVWRGIFLDTRKKNGGNSPTVLACCEQIPLNTFLRIGVKDHQIISWGSEFTETKHLTVFLEDFGRLEIQIKERPPVYCSRNSDFNGWIIIRYSRSYLVF